MSSTLEKCRFIKKVMKIKKNSLFLWHTRSCRIGIFLHGLKAANATPIVRIQFAVLLIVTANQRQGFIITNVAA
jgi:hypothetical protein